MGNMYYTFDYKYGFHPYTVKDISLIIAQYNPVQLVIDDNYHETMRDIVQKRRHSDCQSANRDMFVKTPNSPMKSD